MSTPVIFRKWPESEGGDVIAIFPTEVGTLDPYTSSSYEHVGQHGSADPVGLIQRTKPAKPSEYADLLAELESIGYDDLKVVQRLSPDYLAQRRAALAGYTTYAKPRAKKPSAKRKSGKRSSSTPTSIRGMR
jgi:hypothetical protein